MKESLKCKDIVQVFHSAGNVKSYVNYIENKGNNNNVRNRKFQFFVVIKQQLNAQV